MCHTLDNYCIFTINFIRHGMLHVEPSAIVIFILKMVDYRQFSVIQTNMITILLMRKLSLRVS